MQSYLAFGDDEETLNLGAKAISDHLKAQGVPLEFSLDEGGGKSSPARPSVLRIFPSPMWT